MGHCKTEDHASRMGKYMSTETVTPSAPAEIPPIQDCAISLGVGADGFGKHQTGSSWTSLFKFSKWSHMYVLAASLVSAALVAGIKSVLAVILGKTFDVIAAFSSGSSSSDITITRMSEYSIVLVGLGAANWVANSLFLASWIVFGELQANSVRQSLLRVLLSKRTAWYEALGQGISSLMVRIQTQTRELQLANSQIFGLLVSDVMASLASLAIALYYSWKLTLVLLALLPLSTTILSLISRKVQPAIQAQKHELAVASQHATASLRAADLVQVFGGRDQEVKQYHSVIKRAASHYLVQARCNSIQMGYVSFSVILMFIVGIGYGVVLVSQGLKPGHVITTFYATLATMQGIQTLMPHWLVIAKGLSAGQFLSNIVYESGGGKEADRGERPASCLGTVSLNNVSFAYNSNPTTYAVTDASFTFPPGKFTFIVGKSGSGKSTVGDLIANLHQPSAGEVCVDGVPTTKLARDWIQAHVTLIQQNSVVFTDTFFDNVALGLQGMREVTEEEVLRACDAVSLQSTVASLPEGLNTCLGMGGHTLSGGQTQRLALARARLRDPMILVLDEVTSGLDSFTKSLVMEAMRVWRDGKTTIIITHDDAQILNDDFVYVMDGSRVIEEGTRRELSDRGIFFKLLQHSEAAGKHHTWNSVSSLSSDNSKQPLQAYKSVMEEVYQSPHPSTRSSESCAQTLYNSIVPPFMSNGNERIHDSESRIPVDILEQGQAVPSINDWDIQTDLRRFSAFVEMEFFPERRRHIQSQSSSDSGTSRLKSCDSVRKEIGTQPPDTRSILGEVARHKNGNERHAQGAPKELTESPHTRVRGPYTMLHTLSSLWPAISRNDRIILLLGVGSCIIVSAASPAFSFCFGELLSALWSSDRMTLLRKWVPLLVLIAVVDGLSTAGARYLWERVAQSWVNSLRVKALDRILRQQRLWFDMEENAPGRVNESLDRSAEEMRNIVGRFVPIIITAFLMILSSVLWAVAISWKLTLITLATLPFFVGAVKGYTHVSGRWEAICNDSAEDASATLTEISLNARVIYSLASESYFSMKYRHLVDKVLEMGLKRALHTAWLFGLYQSLNYGITALVLYYGTIMLAREKAITSKELFQVVNLLLFGMGTAVGLLSGLPQLTMAQATAVQMLEYTALPREASPDVRGRQKPLNLFPIRMKDLKFSYPHTGTRCSMALNGVFLEVHQGRCTAIVGQSGSGKSTIVSILLGLHKPESHVEDAPPDSLTFSDICHKDIDYQYFRSKTGYVPQHPFLFPCSIAENIAYGLHENSPYRQIESIWRASRDAGIHDFIMSLPEGYDTIVGEGGQILSGGQAQRLSIARALVRAPALLILDEPTSALDLESADMIRQTIKQLIENPDPGKEKPAIVLVTHNEEMMRVADDILVVENGATVEQGKFSTLLSRHGVLAHLFGSEQPLSPPA